MANEIKNLENAKVSINKQKGSYTGQAVQGVLGITPEGYGKVVFKEGGFLDGRFKNGMFLSGTAQTAKGVVFEGEFYNNLFISGSIKYPNGDYIVGKVDTIKNVFEMTDFRFTQEYGDVITGNVLTLENGKKQVQGKLTCADSSVFDGIFALSTANPNGANYEKDIIATRAFGVQKPILNIVKANARISLASNDGTTANLVGEYANGKIVGEYNFATNNYKQKVFGEFTLARLSAENKQHYEFSEDFGNYYANKALAMPFAYKIGISNGKIELSQNDNSFVGEKITNEQGLSIYKGIFNLNSGKQILDGEFDENLEPINVKVNIEKDGITQTGFLARNGKNYKLVGNQMFDNDDYQKGKFTVALSYQKNFGMPINFGINCRFVSGEYRKTLELNNRANLVYFQGKTADLIGEEKSKYVLLNPEIVDIFAVGILTEIKDGKVLSTRKGIFTNAYDLLEGQVKGNLLINDRETIVETTKTYFKSNGQLKCYYKGKVNYLDNEDFYDGLFNESWQFVKGSLIEHFKNKSVLEAQTKDLLHYKGTLSRKGDFWQYGEFIKNNQDYKFIRGNTIVHFDRPDKAYVQGKYDEKGFITYDNKKLICRVKNNAKRETIDVFACDTASEAMTEFDRKIAGETAMKTSNIENILQSYSISDIKEFIKRAQKRVNELSNQDELGKDL